MWASNSLVLGLEASMGLFPLYSMWGLRPRAWDLPRKHTLTYQNIPQSFQKLQDHLWCINKSRPSLRCRSSFSQPCSFDLSKSCRNRCHLWPHNQQRQHMTREWRWGAQLHQQGWFLPKALMSNACFHDAIDAQQTRDTEILWSVCSLEKILQNHWI